MAVNVLMPALSPTMEQGKLSKWMKKVGDTVKAEDPLCSLESDKATMDVPAPLGGVVGRVQRTRRRPGHVRSRRAPLDSLPERWQSGQMHPP